MKRVFLEPTWKLHSTFDSLLACPPPDYEFVVVEGAIEKGIKLATRWQPSYRFQSLASWVVPVNLLKSFAAKVQSKPRDVSLTYATGHVVLRKEPWVLDMCGDPPYILFGGKETFPRSLWGTMTRKSLASSYCRKIIVRFNSDKEWYMSYFRDEGLAHKLQVVYWGASSKDFVKHYNEDKVKVLFVNSANFNMPRYFQQKGGFELLAAFSELSKRYDNLELVVRSAVPSRVRRELARNNRVRLIDRPIPWDELEHEWRSADIFVYTAPLRPVQVLFDALSYELPIVATDVAGNPEIVEDGENGLLVPRRTVTGVDRELVQALCHKLSILIENPELRRRMGKEARRTAEEKFSIEKRNEALKRVLDEATEGESVERAEASRMRGVGKRGAT
jgi:glycosyltransferase involved in cell wall biosynthesis